jgi:hypothetical protein
MIPSQVSTINKLSYCAPPCSIRELDADPWTFTACWLQAGTGQDNAIASSCPALPTSDVSPPGLRKRVLQDSRIRMNPVVKRPDTAVSIHLIRLNARLDILFSLLLNIANTSCDSGSMIALIH